MHSYKSLAVLALAVSTASTAYSAPVHEDQQQARSVIGGPLNVGRDGLTLPLNITAILDRLHTLQTFEPVAARGDTVDLDQGASASSFTDVLGDLLHNKITQNLISSVAGGVGGAIGGDITKKVLNHTRRAFPLEPLRSCVGLGPEEAAACAVENPIERDDVSTRDVIDVLQLLKRQLIELD